MNVVVLVPRRADGGRRDQVWEWVSNRWNTEHPDYRVIEGHDNADPDHFNRSAAVNAAADVAGEWDVAIIADADSFVAPAQSIAAVEGASRGQFWLSYDSFVYLNRKMSDWIMNGFNGWWEEGAEWIMTGTCSSQVVVNRDLWDEVGGFDDRFVGWGFEDIAFSHACQTFGDGIARVKGPAYHLHHPPSMENDHTDPCWQANRELCFRYRDAAYDRETMRALLDERRLHVQRPSA